VVEDISHEGLRALLRAEGVSFQAVKTWKTSADPDYAAKKARVEHLYAITDGEVAPSPGDPAVASCITYEFGPLNLQPRPGRHWAAVRPELGCGQRQEQGTWPGAAAPAARRLSPYRRGAAPVRCPGAGHRQDVRAYQETQAAR
jgi:hypothetical protein